MSGNLRGIVMKRKNRIIAIIIVAIVLSSFYVWLVSYSDYEGIGDLWHTFTGGKKLNQIIATGTIEATSIDLSAKMPGTIKALNIETGGFVEKEQLVAELERSDLVAQRERDKLSVAKAEVNLADLQSGARTQEIKEAEVGVEIALEGLKTAEEDLARLEKLFQEGAVSQVEYEKALAVLENSKNKLAAAEARLSLIQSGNRQEQIKAAQIEVERSRAVLKTTEAMLEDLKIYSPISGVVASKNYELGEYVTTGASIATIINLDDLWIKVYIPTDDLPKIKLGQKVSFTVSGLSDTFQGVVEEIASRGEFTPKTIQTKEERTNVVFAVKIRINSEGGILKPGMPADVVFDGGIGND
jgi:HlyD family secretion protein